MKKKIISFIGLLLFVGVVAFNMQMINSNKQGNSVILENIVSEAASGYTCFYYYDDKWAGNEWFIDCYGCVWVEGNNPRYQYHCSPSIE